MKINKRIIVFSTYPIKNPLHGGQKRVDAIVKEYRKYFTEVKFIAIFIRDHYPEYDNEDIYLTGKWYEEAKYDHLTSDIKIGNAIKDSPRIRNKIKDIISNFKPDVIQIEQVFPYIGIKDIIDELNISPLIVHSSHNVEVDIKKDVMEIANADRSDIEEAIKIINKYETELAKTADLVSVVSIDDGKYYRELGSRGFIVAKNGTSEKTLSNSDKKYWENLFKRNHIKHSLAFIGSAHLPNMQGLKDIIGYRLGFLDIDTKLILAGSLGKHTKDNFDYSNLMDSTFWLRAYDAGIISEARLNGLLDVTEVILLPINSGGGSNLKTAEAILSGKKIVATKFAFRGFEDYLDLPNIYIAKNSKDFHEKMVLAIKSEKITLSDFNLEKIKGVTWEYTLKDLVNGIIKL
jgi:hypothetical protein